MTTASPDSRHPPPPPSSSPSLTLTTCPRASFCRSTMLHS
ncbi:hypothetical protein E2C01_097159 [Portunus trituberculatus]|uniref:Uncharacterized protein n=1 Tax=Portunus trituberculatus TaxID=210409 RepID=A0A5B7JZR2_PORTR|nr:hypothetical protein [Portunus trituberculatus]